MKQTILAEFIASFLKATPQRLRIARNALIILACIGGAAMYLNNQQVINLPEWIALIFSEEGIIAMLFSALGLQAAKNLLTKNEGISAYI